MPREYTDQPFENNKDRLHYPPHSRLFILGDFKADKDAYVMHFQKYGQIEDITLLKDKKGVVYIKFSKASEAFMARDEENGKSMANLPRPMKIMIAAPREEGSVRGEDEENNFLRLFIKCPTDWKDKQVRDAFSHYGDIDYINVVNDKKTGTPKGLAFVKYFRASSAAKALEECGPEYKAIFADRENSQRRPNQAGARAGGDQYHGDHRVFSPRGGVRRDDYVNRYDPHDQVEYSMPAPPAARAHQSHGGMDPMEMLEDQPHMGVCALTVLADMSVTERQLAALFSIVPGFASCEYSQDAVRQVVKARVMYSSPKCASWANSKLDGFEYPPGIPMVCKLDTSSPRASGPGYGFESRIANLQKAAAELDALGPALCYSQNTSEGTYKQLESFYVDYTEIPLPPAKPLLPRETPMIKRLFIVCLKGAIDLTILRDVFCRFGDLIDVSLLPGKNHGFVKYASEESANEAIATLNMQVIAGHTLKVVEAEERQRKESLHAEEPQQKKFKDHDNMDFDNYS